MKAIRLISLSLSNFKGVKSFTLEADGENVNILGDNATGKTSLFDAFTWLLFDKDSQNKKDFQIKTLDLSGNVIHGLDHEVKCLFEIDGINLELKKVYSEKWTKKRGQPKAEFTGHTTSYFIDEVPAKKGEFTSKVSEIVEEDIFKLLTSPSYFNEQLHWQDRRKILIEIAGSVADEEVINSNKELKELNSILNDRLLEDHKKVIASKRSEINKELEKIPVRIDETEKGIEDLKGIKLGEAPKKIEEYKEFLQAKQQEIYDIKNGNKVSEIQKSITELENEILNLKMESSGKANELINTKSEERSLLKESSLDVSGRIADNKRQIERYNREIAKFEFEINKLRTDWKENNEKVFEPIVDETCSTCGQAIPKEQIEKAKEKALEKFNLDKSDLLSRINEQGKKKKEEISEIENDKKKLEEDNKKLEKSLEKINAQIKTLDEELEKLKSNINSASNPNIDEKQKEINKLNGEIEKINEHSKEKINEIEDLIKGINSDIYEQEKIISKVEQVEKANKRINELKEQERKLAEEFEKLEYELYLTEEFIKTKVNMLEEKINNKFEHAKFKLFEQQVNGGISETCETLYHGVPYSSGLNNAAKINVGLDIINTLSKHYNYEMPIFIDNKEAVTKLINTNSQIITLTVSENNKELKIERGNE